MRPWRLFLTVVSDPKAAIRQARRRAGVGSAAAVNVERSDAENKPFEWSSLMLSRRAALIGLAALIPLSARLSSAPLHGAVAAPSAEKLVQSIVDRYADQYLTDRCRVGVSLVARINDQTYFSNRGTTSRALARRPTPDSVYELASVTKTFVGALAAKAVEDRRITLDGDFRVYLPGDYSNLIRAGKPITLRNLATHTSGLQRDLPDSDALLAEHDYDHIGYRLAALNQGYTRARSLADLHKVELRTVPGTMFNYSNLGIRVLGYGLETVYHASLDRLLRRWILVPLRMSSTGFAVDNGMRGRLVTPYSRYHHSQPLHDSSAGAAYGLFSTPRDMARYLTWQLNERDPVISRSHTTIGGTTRGGQGLIWNIGLQGDERVLWHGGGSFGETSQMVLYPRSREGFVLLANDACDGSETALKDIAMAVHEALRLHHGPGS